MKKVDMSSEAITRRLPNRPIARTFALIDESKKESDDKKRKQVQTKSEKSV